MSYIIKLGTFSKLENATAQPSTTNWAEYSVTLKEGCDISNPDITLSIDWATVSAYNYAYMLNRYYFITAKNMLRNGLCVLQLKVDVLATYKAAIGSTSLYVLRSSTQVDHSIRDNYYPTIASVMRSHQAQTDNIPGDFDSGVYVLNIAGNKTIAGSTLVQFTPDNFRLLINALYTAIDGFQLSDVVASVVQKFGGNPQSLINGAMWFPFPFNQENTLEPIKIGNWNSGIQGGVISDPLMTIGDITFTIFLHPQATVQRSYLNMSPYRQFTLGVPGCGTVQLDSAKLIDETSIIVRQVMDAFTGRKLVKVIAGTSGQILAYMSGQIGIPIMLNTGSDVVGSTLGAIGSAAGLGVGLATGNPAAIVGSTTAGIGNVLDGISGNTNSSVAGCMAAIALEPCWLDQTDIYVENGDNARNGRPYMQVTTPATIGGFMIIDKGDVAISGPLPEQQEIKRFLESGFYYN